MTRSQNFRIFFRRFSPRWYARGEEGGDLPSSLVLVSDQMERMYPAQEKIRSAMIYPRHHSYRYRRHRHSHDDQSGPRPRADLCRGECHTSRLDAVHHHGQQFSRAVHRARGRGYHRLFRRHICGPPTSAGRRASDFFFLHVPLIAPMIREVNARAPRARSLHSSLRESTSCNRSPSSARSFKIIISVRLLPMRRSGYGRGSRFPPHSYIARICTRRSSGRWRRSARRRERWRRC